MADILHARAWTPALLISTSISPCPERDYVLVGSALVLSPFNFQALMHQATMIVFKIPVYLRVKKGKSTL